ncbi:MAG: IPT/TIG domain-containing protein, partial [Bacteroidetes bacterium]|nr:IPT/TIG domain-containing protein [Bacteroidota bacterium]
MKKYFTTVLAFLFFVQTNLFAQVPTITSFTPTTGPVGTTVTITGTNFNTTAANNIVWFGATKATVITASATLLTVTVPVGATYEPIKVLNTANRLMAQSTKPFVVSFGGSGILATTFSSKVDFTTGTPRSVAIGDIDGDGKSDLVVASTTSNKVSVFRNTSTSGSLANSPSSFAAKQDFTTGTYPYQVAIGDLDGDGLSDLVTVNWLSYGTSGLSVFRNTSTSGTVTFATAVGLTTGANPLSVAIGDMDGDGLSDLVVSGTANQVSVYRNNSTTTGTVSFATKVDFPVDAYSRSVVIGDLDGDGKNDFAIANANNQRVSVFRNNSTTIGTVSFDAKQDFYTYAPAWAPTGPYSVAIGDLDGDGKNDLVSANTSMNIVSVLRNNTTTSGAFTASSFATPVYFTVGNSPYSVAIGDLDGDGKSDLAVANSASSSNTVSVLRNTSTSGDITTSSFATKVDFTTGTLPYSVAIGDLDGDGKNDLAAANYTSNTVSVFRNVYQPPPTITSFTPTSGDIGTTVTITGTYFTGASSVKFGGIEATSFTVVDAITIEAVVATGTTGTISVVGTGGTVTSSGTFTLNLPPAPTITSFTPTTAAVGATVTLTGTYFTWASSVKFGVTEATSFIVVNDNTITAVAGSGTTGTIAVTTPGGSVTSSETFTFAPPTITDFTPTSGGTGTTITITGTNFTGASSVKFGVTEATSFTVGSATSITAVVGSGTTGTISVTTPGGTATSSTSLTFFSAPTITSITPTTGVVGATVTITGTEFTGATAVTFGGTAATSFTVDNATTITAVVGSGTTGTIAVTTPGGTATSSETFTFVPPTITDFTPTTGVVGATVTITGTEFTGATSFTVDNATTITAVVGSGTTGTISITTPGGTATSSTSFTFLPPTITNLSPTSGAIGSTVTITGTNFSTTAANNIVWFGGVKATVTTATATSLSVTVPTGAGNPIRVYAPNLGAESIKHFNVTFAGGGSISSSSFATKEDFTTGTDPYSVSIGDLDGDGKMDLAVANYG